MGAAWLARLAPYKALGLLLLVIGCALFAYNRGWHHAMNAQAAEHARALRQALAERDAEHVQELMELQHYYELQQAERVVKEVTEREVIRYVQTPGAARDCLDDDGLQLWNAINGGTAPTAAGAGAAPAVPAHGAAGGERARRHPAG